MDLTALPIQSSNNTNTPTPPLDHATLHSDRQQALAVSPAQTLDPNAIILAEALTDSTIGWRIHNCKVSAKTVTQDKPLPFLYHYDSLEDTIKQANPLTPELLAQFNTPMTPNAAAKLIGIDEGIITSPWHVKIVGSLVVFSEALQLAVRLHWTNTAKDTQQIYTQNQADAIPAAFKDWQFFGRVDVLYKNTKQPLINIVEHSIDDKAIENEPLLTINASLDYQLLPAPHALAIIAKIEADKEQLPWFEAAILQRIE